jgi:hypothetical protein
MSTKQVSASGTLPPSPRPFDRLRAFGWRTNWPTRPPGVLFAPASLRAESEAIMVRFSGRLRQPCNNLEDAGL